MKKVLIVFLFVFVCIISTQAQTYFFSGNHLVETMREYDKAHQGNSSYLGLAGEFFGYVLGVFDAMEFDLPDGVTRGQVAAVVSKYLKEHPELWNRPAYKLVQQAIIEGFKSQR